MPGRAWVGQPVAHWTAGGTVARNWTRNDHHLHIGVVHTPWCVSPFTCCIERYRDGASYVVNVPVHARFSR